MLVELYLFLVFILAGVVQTATGFGYALVAAPLLALALDIKDAVMLTTITSIISMLFLLRSIKNQGTYSEAVPLVASSLIGAVFGAYIMFAINDDWLKIFLAVMLILISCAMWMGYSPPVKHNKFMEYIVGTVNGFLGATTSIIGPIIALYYLNASDNKAVFRGILTRYFLMIYPLIIIVWGLQGTLHIRSLWVFTVEAVPALYIGFLVGEKLFYRIEAETFRKIALMIVLIGSLMLIRSVLSKYF